MTFAWLNDFLPAGSRTRLGRLGWIVFFLFFPLAYVGGVVLAFLEDRPAQIIDAEDRPACIKAAKAFAISRGIPAASWQSFVVADTRDNLLTYYAREDSSAALLARTLAPAREVQVLLRPGDNSRQIRVFLSLNGKVIGFDETQSSITKAAINYGFAQIYNNPPSDSAVVADNPSETNQAEQIARRELSKNAALAELIRFSNPSFETDSDEPGLIRVVWQQKVTGAPDLTLRVVSSVQSRRLIAERVEAHLPATYKPDAHKLQASVDSLYGFFLFLSLCYATFRYVKRMLQKEVSFLRTYVVAVSFAVCFGLFTYFLLSDRLAVWVSASEYSKVSLVSNIVSAIVFAVVGLFVGIGYGSGEGEVREAYPGKLTSVDALLAGKILSRNVGISFLSGAAMAAWLLLAQRVFNYFLQTDVVAVQNEVLRFAFARAPWATLLLGKQYDSFLCVTAGLLLPASLLVRSSLRRRWLRRFWLICFALAAVSHDAAIHPNPASFASSLVALTAALLLPFFAFDVLAAFVSVSALNYVSQLSDIAAAFPSWSGFAVSMAIVGFAAVTTATFFALYGKPVREEDVRPLYAKNLSERMSLEAEILAAREAQLRLLPQSPPSIPGLQLAACCLPAHGVGGDFYDFFPLDGQRIGIFIAQGNSQGLASALCIALAKGVLMHSSLRPLSPGSVLKDLESNIANLIQGKSRSGISLGYAVMDTHRNSVSYACLGPSPHFLLYRNHEKMAKPTLLHLSNRGDRLCELYEGTTQLDAGDYLIFYTDGLARLRHGVTRHSLGWIDSLMSELERPEESLEAALSKVLTRNQRRSDMDLTAVVLRAVVAHATAAEGAA